MLDSVEQLQSIVSSAEPHVLVVVDFYKTSCGACKYIAPGFVKLCKATESDTPSVIFLVKLQAFYMGLLDKIRDNFELCFCLTLVLISSLRGVIRQLVNL